MRQSYFTGHASEVTRKEREAFDIIFQLGHTCWKQFCEAPRGALVRLLFSNETIWRRAEELFMLGFSDRMIESLCFSTERLTDSERVAIFEKSWQDHLARSEGQVLLSGPAYPNTSDSVLRVAKCFYQIGYIRADILLED